MNVIGLVTTCCGRAQKIIPVRPPQIILTSTGRRNRDSLSESASNVMRRPLFYELLILLCGCPHRPHYRSCPFVCPSVRPSVSYGLLVRKQKGVVNRNWCERYPGRIVVTGGGAVFSSKCHPSVELTGCHKPQQNDASLA